MVFGDWIRRVYRYVSFFVGCTSFQFDAKHYYGIGSIVSDQPENMATICSVLFAQVLSWAKWKAGEPDDWNDERCIKYDRDTDMMKSQNCDSDLDRIVCMEFTSMGLYSINTEVTS